VQYDGAHKQWNYFGRPSGTTIVTAPSEVMYGNRIYLVAQDEGGNQYTNLWEMKFSGGSGTWTNFGSHPVYDSLASTPPSVLYDGSLFFVDSGGELINMWWNGSKWIFLNNGWCEVDGWWLWKTYTKVISVGAPMSSSKVFVTCSDGTLRERWYNSSNGGAWFWNNHGKPPSGFADTVPVKLVDGKVFVNVSNSTSGTTTQKHLVERWWTGHGWEWNDHGHPPGHWLVGGAVADPSSQHVYVRSEDGQYWELSWSAGNWQWISHGKP
jgi:hypothetical protein